MNDRTTLDLNCLIGNWPFRKLYRNSLSDLQLIHEKYGVSGGYLASLDAIFYNDPYEADEEVASMIRNTPYHFVATSNPQLSATLWDLEREFDKLHAAAVRLYPGYHQYSLQDPALVSLMNLLKERDKPVFLVMRMEDERLNYLMSPTAPAVDDIVQFLDKFPQNKIVILNARYAELLALAPAIARHPAVFCDIAGLGHQLFVIEKLLQSIPASHICFGSGFPLQCFGSSFLLLQHAQISEKDKLLILHENILRL